MKKRLVAIFISLFILFPIFAEENLDEVISLSAGGTIGVFVEEEIEVGPGYGFGIKLGLGDYITGYYDMIFYEPSLEGLTLPDGLSLITSDQIITGALTLPLSSNGSNELKIGGGYTLINEKITGEYLGEKETLLEIDAEGYCFLVEISSESVTTCAKYIIPTESDNANGLLVVSALINLL
ncbi:MAG: hypothetical protein ACPKM0_06155 [Pleomorphochaeta sp.]